MMRMNIFLSLLLWLKTNKNDNITAEYMIQRKSDAGPVRNILSKKFIDISI